MGLDVAEESEFVAFDNGKMEMFALTVGFGGVALAKYADGLAADNF